MEHRYLATCKNLGQNPDGPSQPRISQSDVTRFVCGRRPTPRCTMCAQCAVSLASGDFVNGSPLNQRQYPDSCEYAHRAHATRRHQPCVRPGEVCALRLRRRIRDEAPPHPDGLPVHASHGPGLCRNTCARPPRPGATVERAGRFASKAAPSQGVDNSKRMPRLLDAMCRLGQHRYPVNSAGRSWPGVRWRWVNRRVRHMGNRIPAVTNQIPMAGQDSLYAAPFLLEPAGKSDASGTVRSICSSPSVIAASQTLPASPS